VKFPLWVDLMIPMLIIVTVVLWLLRDNQRCHLYPHRRTDSNRGSRPVPATLAEAILPGRERTRERCNQTRGTGAGLATDNRSDRIGATAASERVGAEQSLKWRLLPRWFRYGVMKVGVPKISNPEAQKPPSLAEALYRRQ
jgi:hypothetical protein